MNVVYTSDVHVDITRNNRSCGLILYEYLKSSNPDLFILAGDISNSIGDIDDFLRLFKSLDIPKVFVPGNHDIWIESGKQLRKGFDSRYKLENQLPDICKDNGFHYPLSEPLILNDVAIVGTLGWYDYSLRDRRLDMLYSLQDYERGIFGDSIWNDARFVVWLKDRNSPDWRKRQEKLGNREIFSNVFSRFKAVLSLIPDSINKIVVVSHTSPGLESYPGSGDPDPFDAYDGSIEIGSYIKKVFPDKRVCFVVGHRHDRTELMIDENIRLYRAPVGYLREDVDDLTATVLRRIGSFQF